MSVGRSRAGNTPDPIVGESPGVSFPAGTVSPLRLARFARYERDHSALWSAGAIGSGLQPLSFSLLLIASQLLLKSFFGLSIAGEPFKCSLKD